MYSIHIVYIVVDSKADNHLSIHICDGEICARIVCLHLQILGSFAHIYCRNHHAPKSKHLFGRQHNRHPIKSLVDAAINKNSISRIRKFSVIYSFSLALFTAMKSSCCQRNCNAFSSFLLRF